MKDDQDTKSLQYQIAETRTQLFHSSKMAALGTLTAGVAHELNNPIGFVKNNLVMLEEYLQVLLPVLQVISDAPSGDDDGDGSLGERLSQALAGEDLRPILDDIVPLLTDTRDGVQRLGEIVASLRSFARVDGPEAEPFDLNQCVRDTLKVAANELKYRAHVFQSLESIPLLDGKPGEINQVILNLLVNAAQAITGFGEIHIGTRCVGDEVCLSVADNGPGILPEHLEQVFTPFFTTKPASQGTGLGLSISRDIILSHGGRIEVSSSLGEGSAFRVFLPLPREETDIPNV
jgi:two-component system, NtrC family, sensor kinase